MTSIPGRVFSQVMRYYNNLNSSTLNGAIDIIVVQQEDGTLRCTPFHVRFGKLGVLHSSQSKVYITINDTPLDDLYMQLGDAGEAFFTEENTSTTTVPPVRHLEPSDNNTFIDPDNAITSFSDDKSKKLSNIDCSPQIVNKELDQAKSSERITDQLAESYLSEEDYKPKINIDVLHSNTILPARRRIKRRFPNRLSRQPSEDDDQVAFSSMKRRSRARKRDSLSVATNTPTNIPTDEKTSRSVKLLRKRSASEHDLPLFAMDFEYTPYVDARSRFHSIEGRLRTLNLNEITDEKTARTDSNPIPIETTDDIETLNNSNLSKSAPSENHNGLNHRGSQQSDRTEGYYSPTTSYDSPPSPRPTSPKSDTEYELDKSSDQSNTVGWRWKWGELPEQRRSMFQYFWGSSKPKPPSEGLYLEDITSNSHVDRSLYLPTLDYQQAQHRTTNDDDQESGTGNSIPQSPFREHEASCLLGDAQLSLCGNLGKQPGITDEIFNAHLITFETFAQNPAITNDPNLVVRIGGKYYNWPVAIALITSTSVFHKPLPAETIEKLQGKHMAHTKPRATSGGWWGIPFYTKKSDMKPDTPKTNTATDLLAVAAKSEVLPSAIEQNDSSVQLKPSKNSKSDNDSELEDSEVRKLTDKIEQEKVQRPTTTTTTTLKKTMILSSDQLKRLNLKLGQNKVEFSVTTALQGTSTIESNIFLFDHMTKFVISDIDGTITKSDVLGQIIPLVGGDWSHAGIAEFYNAVQENGYQFIYLSARAIGQSQITRNLLRNVKQSNQQLPSGPLLVSPDTLMAAFYREVIAKKPEDFKIECLKNIASLFPGKNPFYAGFGNRINDQWSYTAVGIPVTRIYTINPRGEVVREKLSQALSTNYKNLHESVDLLFPPMDSFSASETYSVYTYWREETKTDAYEDEMRAALDEISSKQKQKQKSTKTKTSSTTKTTKPTVVTKTDNDKLITIAQVTDKNVKRP